MASAVPIVPSDSLARWRDFFASHPHLSLSFPELAQVPIVVDASGVLADLRWIVRRRNLSEVRSPLEEAVAAGTVVAYAPPWLQDEVEKNLPLIAAREELSLEALRDAWTRYRSAIWFYEPSARDGRDAADPKDVPYRDLAKELGGLAVYTKDRHLEAMGAQIIGVRELVLLRDFARAASPGLTLKFAGTVALLVAGAPVVAIVRAGARLVARLPVPIQIGLALAALWAVLNPKSRALLAEAAASPRLQPVKRVVERYLQEVGTSQVAATERWAAVKTSLPARRREPLIAHARAVCAATRDAVSEQAIESAVKTAGYVSRARNLHSYLRRLLRRDPRFVETQRGWWTVIRAPT